MSFLTTSRFHYALARVLSIAGVLFAVIVMITGARGGRNGINDVVDVVCVFWMWIYFGINLLVTAAAAPIVLGRTWNRLRDEGRRTDGRIDYAAYYLQFIAIGEASVVPCALLNAWSAVHRLVENNAGRGRRYDFEHNMATDVAAASVWLLVLAYVAVGNAELLWTIGQNGRRIRLLADGQVNLGGEDDDDAGFATVPSKKGYRLPSMQLRDWASHYALSRICFLLSWVMGVTTVSGLQYYCDIQDARPKAIIEVTAQFLLGVNVLYSPLMIYCLVLLRSGRLRDFREQGAYCRHGRWTSAGCSFLAWIDINYTVGAYQKIFQVQELLLVPADTLCEGWSLRPGAKALLVSIVLCLLAAVYCAACQLLLVWNAFKSWRTIRKQRASQQVEQEFEDEPLVDRLQRSP